jgi:hypothetical protein
VNALVFGATHMVDIRFSRPGMNAIAVQRATITGVRLTRSTMTNISVEPEG